MNILASISFDFDFLPLFAVLVVAWLVPIVMSLLKLERIPTVIIEIIAGFLIGKFIFGHFISGTTEYLEFMALSGFMFLMFLSGMEIDIEQIMSSFPKKRISYNQFLNNPLLIGIAIFAATLMLSYAASFLINMIIPLKNRWFFSLIMVTSSVGIIMPVLKNRGETKSKFGQMIVMSAAVADILSIILFIITAYILKNGFQYELLFIFILFLLFIVFYKVVNKVRAFNVIKKMIYKLSHSASQIQIRGSILLVLSFIVVAQFIGEEVMLLGAFLSGLLLSFFVPKDRSILVLKLDALGYGFFIPIFFIMVGVEFDYKALAEFDNSLWIILISFLILLYLVKLIPSLLLKRNFGFNKAIAAGFILSSRLSLIIAASKIGLDIGVISPGINASVIILAVITCFASPIIFNIIYPPKNVTENKVFIIGGSSTGVLLSRRFEMHEKRSVIVDNNENRYKDMKARGLHTFLGNGLNSDTYRKLKLKPLDYVVVTTGNEELNTDICEMLKNEFGHENIITKQGKSLNSEVNKRLKQLQIETFDVTRILATTIENLILRPTTYHTLVETFDNFSVEDILVKNKFIHGKQVMEIPIHTEGFLMLIRRDNEMIVPHGNTHLKLGDMITVFGTDTAIEAIKEQFV